MAVSFDLQGRCRARAEEVFKLLWDPARFPEWWAGMDRVEEGADGRVTRYMAQWPDFAYPTDVAARRDGAGVTISCLLSDIRHEWSLVPDPGGCIVAARVELPDEEAERADALKAETEASLTRLIALAEHDQDE